MCFEMVCRDDLKLSAIAPGVNACTASSVRMALRVGSAMAWNTSRFMTVKALCNQTVADASAKICIGETDLCPRGPRGSRELVNLSKIRAPQVDRNRFFNFEAPLQKADLLIEGSGRPIFISIDAVMLQVHPRICFAGILTSVIYGGCALKCVCIGLPRLCKLALTRIREDRWH